MHCPVILAIFALPAAATYSLNVCAPGTAVDGMVINAASQSLYAGVNVQPSTYCPIGRQCPPDEGTLVYDQLTAMAVSIMEHSH